MTFLRNSLATALALLLIGTLSARIAAQNATTGAITGRAIDESGLAIPGVTVTITSPAMIGGGRNAVTDAQGAYRFTQLVPGAYRVAFALQGFNGLNVDNVTVTVSATMTINGTMTIGTVSEAVTVTSEAPVIDLEAATVGVNWSRRNLEELPFGKSLPSLVGMIPGLYSTQYDVGASTMGGTAAPPARTYGRTGGNAVMYDGVLWDQTFGDFGSYDEIQITSAAKGAEASSPGASYSFVIKSGGNQFHGSGLTAWQDDAFQSNNITQEIIDRGMPPTSNKYTRYTDFKGDLGGPLMLDKLWFYASYTDSYAGQYISGFVSEASGQPEVFFTRLYGPTVKVTFQPAEKMKFDITQNWMRKWQPYRGADQFKTLEATESQDYWSMLGAAKWTYFPTSKLTADLAINRAGYWWTTGGWTSDVRTTDLTSTETRGTNLSQYRDPLRYQWNGNISWYPEFAGRNHEVRTGFLGYWDLNRSEVTGYPNQQVYRYRSVAGDPDYFDRPDSVQVFDYPNNTSSGVMHNSWFVNDKVNMTTKLTVNAGLRFDRYSSWLPEQGNPGTGPFSTPNIYPERHDFPVYNNWSPRLSVAYDVLGDGRLALKGSYGRYVAVGQGLNPSPGPTAASVNPATTIVKTYNSWDGSIPYVPVPANLGSTTGGGGTQTLDPDLVAGVMNEFTAGAEFGSRTYILRFNVVHKRDVGGSKTLDVAMPYEAYTDVRSAVDPGPDNITGTEDDGVMYAWSVPRTYPGFGQVNTFTTNVADGEGGAEYTGYEATFSKHYSRGWSLLVSGTADVAHVHSVDPQNPNQELYTWDFPKWSYGIKVNGTYNLPWGITYAATYSAQSGEYFTRSAQMRNALNSTVTVVVDGNAGRYDWVKIWDNRFSKKLVVGRNGQSLDLTLDIYNTMNSSVVLQQVNVNGPDYLKPSAGSSSAATASAILPPRILRLGMRYSF